MDGAKKSAVILETANNCLDEVQTVKSQENSIFGVKSLVLYSVASSFENLRREIRLSTIWS